MTSSFQIENEKLTCYHLQANLKVGVLLETNMRFDYVELVSAEGYGYLHTSEAF